MLYTSPSNNETGMVIEMCQSNVQIEDRLHSAGYKTERTGGIVSVYDPVHQSFPGSSALVVTHFNLKEIRSTRDAWSFIDARQ
jgi:hypothetical protein